MSKDILLNQNENMTTADSIYSNWEKNVDIFSKKIIDTLRDAQIGSLHSIFSHWSLSNSPATIVLPTGIGKTDTMIGAILGFPLKKTLIIVPTETLRTQITNKVYKLGIFKEYSLVDDKIFYPIVLKLSPELKDRTNLIELFNKANVIVSTIQMIYDLSDTELDQISKKVDAVFFDEAHHVEAISWSRFKKFFVDNKVKVLQFTATPFRNDKKELGGSIIYRYPIAKAQANGYFKKINLLSIYEFDDELHDHVLAQQGIEILQKDLKKYSHVLMARTGTIERANEIAKIYTNLAPELQLAVINSDLTPKERNKIIEDLKNNKIQIIVCVDMLGEGFDLANLKIAVLHDAHKSLPAFIQFIGRFTRSSTLIELGDASIIINKARDDVNQDLQDLYELDSEWNQVISEKIDSKIDFIKSKKEFDSEFIDILKPLNLDQLIPNLSTITYKTKNNFYVDRLLQYFDNTENTKVIFAQKSPTKRILVIVYSVASECDWIKDKSIRDLENNLLIFYQPPNHDLTFVNSINTDLSFTDHLQILTGDTVEILDGDIPFRAFDGLTEICMTNSGIRSSGSIRFKMLAGTNITDEITPEDIENKIVSNLFGSGYEYGEDTNIGASQKGRVWSYKTGSAYELVEWLDHLVIKLRNNAFEFKNVFQYALKRQEIKNIPEADVALIEWEEHKPSLLSKKKLKYSTLTSDLMNASLECYSKDTEKICIKLKTTEFEYNFAYIINRDNASKCFIALENEHPLYVTKAGKDQPFITFLEEFKLVIYLLDDSFIINHYYFCSKKNFGIYSEDQYLTPINWKDTERNIEAMKSVGDKSVQGFVFNNLIDQDAEIILHDDGADEIADLVEITCKDKIHIKFFHCKYMKKGQNAAARIGDISELCSQILKSLRWKKDVKSLLKQMIKRSKNKSRLIKGTKNLIVKYMNILKVSKSVVIEVYGAQPAFSLEAYNSKAREQVKALLNFTWRFAKEKYGVDVKFYIDN